jgi:hypothetical protein
MNLKSFIIRKSLEDMAFDTEFALIRLLH